MSLGGLGQAVARASSGFPGAAQLIPRYADNASSFPQHLLDGCESALVLFAAAFNGAQDAVWILDAGMTATCVDNDAAALERMSALYPDDWQFVKADAFEFAEETQSQWDVVTIDCPSGTFEHCADLVDTWCALARRAVILGTGVTTPIVAPAGWRMTERRYRSGYAGGVYWAVLEREL